jgi:alpha-methylacyl-CoA racemase
VLEGVTVLDLASVGPAARASRWLADYGAAVVKVGPLQGGVQIVPPFHSYSAHRGMQRILIDLKSAGGLACFLRLCRSADVVIESFRPGVMDRLGAGYAAVSAVNDAIVYCSTSGYGQDGPHSGWAGHDLNYLAVSGFLDCSGRGPDGKPPIPGATVADSAGGGMHAVMAILAALVRQRTTGEGAYLDVSAAEGMLSIMALAVDEHLATGATIGPGSSLLTGRYACYDVYPTADGGWLTVAAIEPRFWANLCQALDLPQWADRQLDDSVQDRMRADIAGVLSGRSRDEWVQLLAPRDTCVAPVLSVDEVSSDPQYVARGCFVSAVHPSEGAFRQVGAVLAGMSAGGAVRDAAATDAVSLLAAAGLSDPEIDALVAEGAVA